MTDKPRRLRDIAGKIGEYLKKFEDDPNTNRYSSPRRAESGMKPFYMAGACQVGRGKHHLSEGFQMPATESEK